jgi:hypothetical protein
VADDGNAVEGLRGGISRTATGWMGGRGMLGAILAVMAKDL